MTTQITNKQVKIITDANFNNNKIVNAKIDASENEITNLPESGKVDDVLVNGQSVVENKDANINIKTINNESLIGNGNITINVGAKSFEDAGITKITSSDTMIDLAQEIESKDFSVGTSLFGEIENLGMPFSGNAEVRVDILDEKDDGDQVILFTLYSTNVAPYEWEWRYYLSLTVNWLPKAIPTDDYTSSSTTTVPTSKALHDGLETKQNILIEGNNISIDGATISAIVPTKISELENDSQYITNVVDDLVNYTTTVGLSNVALSGSYNDLTSKPQINGVTLDGNKETSNLKIGIGRVDYFATDVNKLPVAGGAGATAFVITNGIGYFYKANSSTSYNWVIDYKTQYVGQVVFIEDTQEMYVATSIISAYANTYAYTLVGSRVVEIADAAITIANIRANTNYKFTNENITSITFTACEQSFEETVIKFTTGSTAPTLTDNSGLVWYKSIPILKANSGYTIVIYDKTAYWEEQ